MRQKLIILITLFGMGIYAHAQEYRITKSSGNLKINLNGVIVEGYDGKDIIFSGQKVVNEEINDERAKGLVPISSSKYVDNTGLGINVSENGQDVNVNLVAKKPIGILTIKVPNAIKVSILNNGNGGLFYSYSTTSDLNFGSTIGINSNMDSKKTTNDIILKNLKNEIEVSVSNSNIRLENNSGPMSIKTVSGAVDAIFAGEIKGPVSIISVNNYVDITLPATTKANIEMGTSGGKLFAGKEFKIDIDKTPEAYDVQIGSITTRPASSRSLAGQQANRDAARTSSTIQGQNRATEGVVIEAKGVNRLATRNTKSKDTATIVSVNGQHIITTDGVARVQGKNKLSGSLTTLDGVGAVSGYQLSSDALNYNNASSIYSVSHLFNGGDRIKGKLNGGGIDLIFKSTNKNVYLRQQ